MNFIKHCVEKLNANECMSKEVKRQYSDDCMKILFLRYDFIGCSYFINTNRVIYTLDTQIIYSSTALNFYTAPFLPM